MPVLPNCRYCGKFCNPKNEGVKSEDVYGFMGIDATIYYHEECRKKKSAKKEVNHRLKQ